MEKVQTQGVNRFTMETGMEEIDKLYGELFVNNGVSRSSNSIDPKVRAKIYKKILDDLDELRERQRHVTEDSSDYRELDRQIRMRLLKEIQVIMDEYIVARQNNNLRKWKAMYGDIERYRENFYYYRMDKKYEDKKKVLKDYRFA